MRGAIVFVMLVSGVWVCPETAWPQRFKSSPTPQMGVPPLPKRSGALELPVKPFRKSDTPTPSQPVEGSDFDGSSLGLVPNPQGPFKWISRGTFQMGSTAETDPDQSYDESPHKVTLNHGFWLLDHEVTQEEYRAIEGSNPSRFQGDPSLPVERVSWQQAADFCDKLTNKDRQAGRISPKQKYRLPTEAEWEYAARAGTTGARHGELDAIAWYSSNAGGKTHVVKQKLPNAWGLYDMIGNVWEWCSDWYNDYPSGDATDPKGSSSGFFRVLRGGSWYDGAGDARSACRLWHHPDDRDLNLGFRPALISVQ